MPKTRDQLARMRAEKPDEANALEQDWKNGAHGRDKYRQRMLRLMETAITIFNRDHDEKKGRHYCEVQRISLEEVREIHNDSPYLGGKFVTFRKEPVPLKGVSRIPSTPSAPDPEDI